MRAGVQVQTNAKAFAPSRVAEAGLVQRKCACGGHAGLDGECETCREIRLAGRPGLTGDDDRPPIVQPRLVVGPPDDEYEREAERMAELVTSEQAPEAGAEPDEIEAAPPGGEEDQEQEGQTVASGAERADEEETVRTKAVPDITPFVQRRAISMPRAAEEEQEETALEAPEVVEEPEEYVQTRAEGVAPGAGPSPAAPVIQRQAETAEDEEPEKEEDEKEEEEPLRRRTSLAMGGRDEGEVGLGLSNRLRAATQGGSPLPAATRAAMERAFGADFGLVRIHADPTADSLARSFRAYAFTTREHIFFRDGEYDPSSPAGRRLLAHELTHVLQQQPGLQHAGRRAQGSPRLAERPRAGGALHDAPLTLQTRAEVVQRDGPGDTAPGFVVVGKIQLFDAQARELEVEGPGWQTDESADMLKAGPGVYPATITGAPGAYKLSFAGQTFTLIQTPSNLKKLLRQARTILVVIFSANRGLLKEEPPTPGVGGQPPAPPPPAGGPPGGKPGEAEKLPEGKQPGEPGKGTEGQKPGEPGKEGEGQKPEESGKEGTSIPADKQQAGSKYGWLGLINLPMPVIKALEFALELLSDSEEMEALVELLRLLSELGKHVDAIKELFTNTDELLLVALGIKENDAIKALETWVEKRPPRPKRRGNRKLKGVRAIATRLFALIEKVRTVLGPIFKLRREFRTLLGAAAAFVEGVEGFEELLEAAKSGKAKAKLDELVEYVAAQLGARISGRLEQGREDFKLIKQQFLESDLISRDELAAAVTHALLMLVPKPYRPFVKVAKELGLDTLVAENVIGPIIPQDVLDALNDQLRALTKKLDETFITAVESDLNSVFDGLGRALQEHLEPALKKLVLQPRYKPGAPAPPPGLGTLAAIERARGEPLPQAIRDEMEGAFGFRFDGVRVFHDAAAGRASEMVGASAFTLGPNVYFGPGQFAPDSPEGRRLLAHELTHVVQQSQGLQRGVIQRTWKEVRDKLVAKFGDVALEGLRGIFRAGAAKKAEAEKILKEVDRLVAGKKKVRQKTGPRLPIAYVYVRNNKGNITGIRRKLEWLSAVPALSINSKTRVIQLGFLSRYDPKKLDRARLRAALGCKPGYEAHHVIPLELRGESLVRIAVRNGWNFNGQENGLCLGGRVHSGSHPKYTADVRARLRRLQGSTRYRGVTDWKVLQKPFQALVDQLKAELKQRRRKLD